MNKIYSLLLLVLMSYSCSNDDVVSKDNPQQRKPGRVINALDPTKLARVIFYPGTNNERRWFFYPNGLLKKIVDANGTLLQTFVYDTNNNWVQFQFAETVEEEEVLKLEQKEIELIKKSLEKNKGKRKAAADELGISERTLYRKIKQFDL